MPLQLPLSWQPVVGAEFQRPYFQKLSSYLEGERSQHQVFPPEEDVFAALTHTSFDMVKVVIVGQDPYHDDGQAHGLAFSVRPGIKTPPSLVNIFKELREDLGCTIPNHGCLIPWAEQGVLLLNTVLTVRAHEPASHKGQGWETFTDAVLEAVGTKKDRVIFVLWGAHAQKKKKLIQGAAHLVLESAHPSPLSAKNGFFGSRPFSKVNTALREAGRDEVAWQLANLTLPSSR